MGERAVLTELKELTEQKSPNLNKQRAHVWHRLPQAGQADSGGVVTVTKSTININAKVFLSRFSIIHFLPLWHTSLAPIIHLCTLEYWCCFPSLHLGVRTKMNVNPVKTQS